VQSLRFRNTESAAPSLGRSDLAQDLILDADRFRRIAASTARDSVRDALIALASQCDQTAAMILRERGADSRHPSSLRQSAASSAA